MHYDPVTMERAGRLHPLIRRSFLQGYDTVLESGIAIRMTYSLRTFPEQDDLYAIGRTKPGQDVTVARPMGRIVTWARGGYSFHNYGLAFDFCLLHADKTISFNLNEDIDADHVKDWIEVVQVFADLGWEAGINWPSPKKDPPHLQMTFGKTVTQLRVMHAGGQADEFGYLKLAS